MNYDNVADNEDQLYRDILEEEQKEKSSSQSQKSSNNYDDEGSEDY